MTASETRTVLVTGASRGLGRAIAERFAEAGTYVVVGYRRREEEARQTLDLVRAAGGDGELAGFDVSNMGDVERAVARIVAARGAIDVVVNNAGVVDDAPFALMTREQWDRVMHTDLDGTFCVSRAAISSMLRHKRGAIVNVASAASARALPGQANYAAAKGGVVSFTRSLAAELAPHGIRVNAVLPGLLSVGMGARTPRDYAERLRAIIPVKRPGTADEVARVIVFLASDAASYVTGQAIAVDGGLSL
jgi:3-oxoacyl-[acyl-carrier protein] reductase